MFSTSSRTSPSPRSALFVVVAVILCLALAIAPGAARAQGTQPQRTQAQAVPAPVPATVPAPASVPAPEPDFEKLPFAPRHAIVNRVAAPLTMDGKLDEPSWRATPWSDAFVDIQGGDDLRPRFRTRVKMLWDDDYFYVAAELEEPDIWGTLKERDSVIFHDNDFEVFIDPDGDTHNYYELEVNALGTPWDLLLAQPYRDGGSGIHAWDIAGLRIGVDVRGTLNRPGDRDEAWTVEIAMPWTILREAAPGRRAPRAGEQWRVNFSRVEWQTDITTGAYVKRADAKTGKPLPEDNWVWSPQGAINMHMPERWGFVQFSDTPAAADAGAGTAAGAGSRAGTDAGAGAGTSSPFVEDPNERVKWALRRLYYRQRRFRATHDGKDASNLSALDASTIKVEGLAFRPVLQVTNSLYEITAPGFNGTGVHIRQDGKVWLTNDPADPAAERAILEAVLHDPRTIHLFGGRRVQVGGDTELWAIHPWVKPTSGGPSPDGLSITLYETHQSLRVPDALLEDARRRNRRSLSVKGLSLPDRPKGHVDPNAAGWERITLSRPGISADGLTAIVAITRSDFASAGHTVYLQKQNGVWKLVGEGAIWVV